MRPWAAGCGSTLKTKRLEPKPLHGPKPRVDESGLRFVRRLVEQRPDATLNELAHAVSLLRGTTSDFVGSFGFRRRLLFLDESG
jgi:hypothetical protein